MVKIRLLTDILFEYGGIKKTLFKTGTILDAKNSYTWKWDSVLRLFKEDEHDGYWITNGERGPKKEGLENPGSLVETKCFLHECEVI